VDERVNFKNISKENTFEGRKRVREKRPKEKERNEREKGVPDRSLLHLGGLGQRDAPRPRGNTEKGKWK
jgi:hypothetical protein